MLLKHSDIFVVAGCPFPSLFLVNALLPLREERKLLGAFRDFERTIFL